jgi:hypothetical protein
MVGRAAEAAGKNHGKPPKLREASTAREGDAGASEKDDGSETESIDAAGATQIRRAGNANPKGGIR